MHSPLHPTGPSKEKHTDTPRVKTGMDCGHRSGDRPTNAPRTSAASACASLPRLRNPALPTTAPTGQHPDSEPSPRRRLDDYRAIQPAGRAPLHAPEPPHHPPPPIHREIRRLVLVSPRDSRQRCLRQELVVLRPIHALHLPHVRLEQPRSTGRDGVGGKLGQWGCMQNGRHATGMAGTIAGFTNRRR